MDDEKFDEKDEVIAEEEVKSSMKEFRSFEKKVLTEQNVTDYLLTEREAAEFLRVMPRTLRYLRHMGRGPAFIKISGKYIRYERQAILDWLDSQRSSR